MRYRFYITDVFTATPFAGNQLGVLPDAAGISAVGMQRIAREFNFSETTFVVPPSKSLVDRRVRIFTPQTELKFAGHPTVGTAYALVRGGHVRGRAANSEVSMVLEEAVGPIEATVVRNASGDLEATFTLETRLEQPACTVTSAMLAKTLQLPPSTVLESFFGGIGVNFTFARLTDPKSVDAAVLDHAAWEEYLAGSWAPQIFLFASQGVAGSFYARMFAPALGVAEDPATGSACGALAAILASRQASTREAVRIAVTQGVAMGRRSEINAGASILEQGIRVSVGGVCAHVAEGEIDVPPAYLESKDGTGGGRVTPA
jgi:trans-2,3-dihydro-3-hydroxyanthranilate isomerase